MSKWALIRDQAVIETSNVDPKGRYHPNFNWVECADNVEVGYSYVNGQFNQPSLSELKQQHISNLKASCANQIVSGFNSDALGATHLYPCQDHDQRNLIASVTASNLPALASTWTTKFWCADSTGAWAFREHTAGQIQKAGLDGKAFIEGLQAKLETLTQQVESATNTADIQSIIWS